MERAVGKTVGRAGRDDNLPLCGDALEAISPGYILYHVIFSGVLH